MNMKPSHWWMVLISISVGVLSLDIITSSYLLFPITFVIPVFLGTWYLGRRAGIGFALVLVGCRLVIATALEPEPVPLWAAAMNAVIRLAVLIGLAMLVDKVAQQKRALDHRVQVLEGILPICSFCKKIRRPDGKWEPVEVYVTKRSDAQFSHGFCEECMRQHYGEYLADDNADESKPAPK